MADAAGVESPRENAGAAAARTTFSMRAARAGRAALEAVRDVIVPPVCLSCHAPLVRADCLCVTCWVQVDFIREPLCDRLGIPLSSGGGGPILSAAAIADPPVFDRARAVAEFGPTMQKLVHAFKYSDRHDARRLFGRWLSIAGRDLIAGCDVIVPVPLHRWRLLERRYNQSAILANEIARASGLPVAPLALVRTRETASQVGLTGAERVANVAGAFAVSPGRKAEIAGRAVLLVDDVITTGATCNSAARALKAAGASRVEVLVLAMVVHGLK